MPIDMRKIIFVGLILSIISSCCPACEPEEECPETRCKRSSVFSSDTVYASLTGNFDSVINIGDTFSFEIKLKDTINTNYGNLIIKNIDRESFFRMNYGGMKNFWDDIEEKIYLKRVEIGSQSITEQEFRWDIINKKYKCFLIPTQKGKYLIELKGGTFVYNLIDGRKWVVNTHIKFYSGLPFRVGQARSFWKTDSLRNQITNASMEQNRGYWYWFEVK
jgi:hypothetical protein